MLLDCKENSALSMSTSLLGAVDPEVLTMDSFKGNIKKPTDYLSTLFKLNLLLSKNLYLPSGYLFDNPAFQRLLSEEAELRNLLYSQVDDSSTALYLGVDSNSSDRLSGDHAFDNWLYGLDGARINRPCSPLYVGNAEFNKYLEKNIGNKVFDLERYYSGLYPNQYNYTDVIRKAFECSTQVVYPSGRHSLYKNELLAYFTPLSEIEGEQTEEYLKLVEFIENSKKVSRSEVKKDFPSLWFKHLDQFISLRQKTYFGGDSGCLSPYFTKGGEFEFTKYVSSLISDIYENPRNHFQIVVDRLTFDDLRKIREKKDYISTIDKLDNLIGEPNKNMIDDVRRFLKTEWAPQLFSSVGEVNKSAIVDDSSKREVVGTSLSGIAGISGTIAGVMGLGAPAIAFALVGAITASIYASSWYGYRNSLVKFKKGI